MLPAGGSQPAASGEDSASAGAPPRIAVRQRTRGLTPGFAAAEECAVKTPGLSFILRAFIPVSAAAAGAALLPALPSKADITIGDYTGARVTLLAIDDYSLPLKSGLCLYLSRPAVRAEPVLTPSRGNPHATDTMATHFYGTVLHEGGRFRMWYYGSGWTDDPAQKGEGRTSHEGPICFAESPDGLHWTKPNLGQVVFRGGSDNNAIALPATATEGAFVIREDSEPDPARRYKMIYENTSGPLPIVDTAVSADGIRWHPTGTAARVVEPSSFYRFHGLYAFSGQSLSISEGGHRAGRQGLAWFSPDFVRWLPEVGEAFLLPEPSDPNARGHDRPYTQVHLGVGAVSYGNVLVGLYGQWHARPYPGDWFGTGTTYGDIGLVVSNDGQHFREPVKGHVFLDRHDSPAAIPSDIRSEEVVTQSGNGILTVGSETWIYHGRWMNTEKHADYYAEIALATLARDRWGALGLVPGADEGSVWTAPITAGQGRTRLLLNAEGTPGISVDVADENFQFHSSLSGNQAGTIAADGLDRPVAWAQGSLETLAGRKVRFHIRLHRGAPVPPRLFAAYVTGE